MFTAVPVSSLKCNFVGALIIQAQEGSIPLSTKLGIAYSPCWCSPTYKVGLKLKLKKILLVCRYNMFLRFGYFLFLILYTHLLTKVWFRPFFHRYGTDQKGRWICLIDWSMSPLIQMWMVHWLFLLPGNKIKFQTWLHDNLAQDNLAVNMLKTLWKEWIPELDRVRQ